MYTPDRDHVVLIDDSELARDVIGEELRRRGYRVTAVADGDHLEGLLSDVRPELVVTDLHMPSLTGIDVLGIARALAPDLPVLVMTSDESIDSVLTALRSGAFDYLIKPGLHSAEGLAQAVERALQFYRLVRENQRLEAELQEREARMARELSQNLDVANQRLLQQMKVLEQRNERLEQEILHHEQTQRALRQARDSATQAEQSMANFLASMSHEIRSPLNGILGVAELLTRTELAGPQMRYAETIRRSGETLLSIVDDLLDLSKLDAGAFTYTPETLPMMGWLDEFISPYATMAHPGVVLFMDMDPDVPDNVRVSPVALRHILANLVSNALKFTTEGHVGVLVTWTEVHGLQVVVEDSGPGIPAEELPRLFDRFYQAQSRRRQTNQGTGLGLAICQQITEQVGGTLTVESAEGQGSRFILVLPADGTMGAAKPLRNWRIAVELGLAFEDLAVRHIVERLGADVVEEPDEADLLITDQAMSHSQVAQIARVGQGIGASGALERPVRGSGVLAVVFTEEPTPRMILQTPERRALIADDNPVNQLVLREMLKHLGYAVVEAGNGQEVVASHREEGPFDLVVLDLHMPVLDGVGAAVALREAERTQSWAQVPIIGLSASVETQDRTAALSAGMNAFLSKPVRLDDLREVLRAVGP